MTGILESGRRIADMSLKNAGKTYRATNSAAVATAARNSALKAPALRLLSQIPFVKEPRVRATCSSSTPKKARVISRLRCWRRLTQFRTQRNCCSAAAEELVWSAVSCFCRGLGKQASQMTSFFFSAASSAPSVWLSAAQSSAESEFGEAGVPRAPEDFARLSVEILALSGGDGSASLACSYGPPEITTGGVRFDGEDPMLVDGK
jgi:hypothetical protein